MQIDYLELDRRMRLDLRRHHFREREHLIALVVLDFSFALGRPAALIPRLENFSLETGITKGNVHSALQSLAQCRVLGMGHELYWPLPRSQANVWQVRPRVGEREAAENSANLRARQLQLQQELLPAEPSLAVAMAEVAQEFGGVPKSGTIVPDSGTGGDASDLRYTFNVSDPKRRTSNVGVPNSGTAPQLARRVREFVGERDWERYWAEGWQDRFEEPQRAAALGKALDFVSGGVKTGEIKIRKTRGAALWDETKRQLARVP